MGRRADRADGPVRLAGGLAGDRIRAAKDTGLTNLPLHDFAQNRVWCAVVALALDLLAWTQTLALAGHPARRWEPKRLRHRLFTIAGRIVRHARQTVLHLPCPPTIRVPA